MASREGGKLRTPSCILKNYYTSHLTPFILLFPLKLNSDFFVRKVMKKCLKNRVTGKKGNFWILFINPVPLIKWQSFLADLSWTDQEFYWKTDRHIAKINSQQYFHQGINVYVAINIDTGRATFCSLEICEMLWEWVMFVSTTSFV